MGEWLNAAEAAQRLGVKQATLYAYVSRGMLARRRGEDGRSSLFEADEVARLAEQAQKGQPRRAAGTGDFVIESGLTEVADGRIRYRGMEVTKLALWRPFEEVASWLWTGRLGQDGMTASWQATAEAVAAGTRAQAALPEGTLPLERLRVIVPAMAATDPLRLHLDAPAVVAAAATSSPGWWTACPIRAPRRAESQPASRPPGWPRAASPGVSGTRSAPDARTRGCSARCARRWPCSPTMSWPPPRSPRGWPRRSAPTPTRSSRPAWACSAGPVWASRPCSRRPASPVTRCGSWAT